MQSVFSTTDNSGEFSDFEIEVDQDKIVWGKMKGSNSAEDDTWIAEVSFISSPESLNESEETKGDSQTQASSKVAQEKNMINAPCDGFVLPTTAYMEITNGPAERSTNNIEKCTTFQFSDWITNIGKDSSNELESGDNPTATEMTVSKNEVVAKPKDKTVINDRKITPKCHMTTRLRVKMHDLGETECIVKNNTRLQSDLRNSLAGSSRTIHQSEIMERNCYKSRSNSNVKTSCTTHIRLQTTSNRFRRLSFPFNQPINKSYDGSQIKNDNFSSRDIKVNSINCDDKVATSRHVDKLTLRNNCIGSDLPKELESSKSTIKGEDINLQLNSIIDTTVLNPINHLDASINNIKKRRKPGSLWKRGILPKQKGNYKNWPQKFKGSNSSPDNSQCSTHTLETSSFVTSSPQHSMTADKFYTSSKSAFHLKKLKCDDSFNTVTHATTFCALNVCDETFVEGVPELAKPEMNSSISKGSENHKANYELCPVVTKHHMRPRRQLKPSILQSSSKIPSSKNFTSSTENASKRKKGSTVWNSLTDSAPVQKSKPPKINLNYVVATPSGTSLQGTKISSSKSKNIVKKNALVPKIVLKKCATRVINTSKETEKNEKKVTRKCRSQTAQKKVPPKEKLSNLASKKKKAIQVQLKMSKRRSHQTNETTKNNTTITTRKTKQSATHATTTKTKAKIVLKPSKGTPTPQTTPVHKRNSPKASMTSGASLKADQKSQNSGSTVPPCSPKLNQTPYISQSQLQLQHLASTFPMSPTSQSYLSPVQPLTNNMLATALPSKKTATRNRSQSGQPPNGGGRVGRPPKNVSSPVHSARMTVEHSLTGSSTDKNAQGSHSNFASTVTCLPRVVLPHLSWSENNAKRSSVRQTECAFRYREIIVKKMDDFIQIVLASNTRVKNGLNCQAMYEMRMALTSAKSDCRCHLVVVHGTGSVFCSGVDLISLSMDKGQSTADKMSNAVRDFCKVLLSFPKPLVAAVNGAAVGLGVTFLPLFDLVYASDKATFYTPYCKLGQIPEGGATLTLPSIMGYAKANGLLLEGRRLTATEAHDSGLVTQVLWPASFMEEVIPRVQALAKRPLQAMESTKALVRYHAHSKLEVTLDTECRILLQQWSSDACRAAIRDFLQFEEVV